MRFATLTIGRTFDLGLLRLSAEEITAFAKDFDPQPQHLDADAAKATVLGGLCASGWQTCAAVNRLILDALRAEGDEGSDIRIGAFDEVRWKAPVFADRDYPVRAEITSRGEADAVLTATASSLDDTPVAVVKARLKPIGRPA